MIATATRVALVVTCDIEEGISAVLRMRGFDGLTSEQRVAVLKESPDDIDLFRFSLSDVYFEMRKSIGVALRSQPS